MKISDRFQYPGQKSRLIIHLNDHRNGLSLCCLVKRKNIIFILVKRTAADPYTLCRLRHCCGLTGIDHPFCLHYFQQYFRHCLLFQNIILHFVFHGNEYLLVARFNRFSFVYRIYSVCLGLTSVLMRKIITQRGCQGNLFSRTFLYFCFLFTKFLIFRTCGFRLHDFCQNCWYVPSICRNGCCHPHYFHYQSGSSDASPSG